MFGKRFPLLIQPGFLRTLATLRWWAAAGQAATILATLEWLQIPLPAAPLWGGVTALLAFNLALWVYPVRDPVAPMVAVAHLGFDIAQLTFVIAHSGGAMNPFVSLFLVPIALATLVLPVRHILGVAALATLGYALAATLGPALPHIHGIAGTFDLHLWGMAVNFVLSAIVFVAVLTRLAATRDARERELARLREQSARDEGILGLATHAAAMAHALNTPLGTLTLILDDLLLDCAGQAALQTEVERARAVVAVCRDQVRKLVHDAHPDAQAVQPLADYLSTVVARWELLRPAITLQKSIDLPGVPVRADPALAHLLQALLDNAADAGLARAQTKVQLTLRVDADRLVGEIVDHGGPALAQRPLAGTLYASTKADGMGVGLALSHATVERLGGELTLQPGADGAVTRFTLPVRRLTAG